MSGLEATPTNEPNDIEHKLDICLDQADCVLIFQSKETAHTTHGTLAVTHGTCAVAHGTRAQISMIIYLKPVPAQGRQELWRAVQFQIHKYVPGHVQYLSQKERYVCMILKKKNEGKKKTNDKKGMLAWIRVRVLKLKVAPKLLGPAACSSLGKKTLRYKRHTHA